MRDSDDSSDNNDNAVTTLHSRSVSPGSLSSRDTYNRIMGTSRAKATKLSGFKLPAFTGKETWKTWINRFEALAEKFSLNDEEKHTALLQRLDGKAADVVFSQFSFDVRNNYKMLVRELNNRYRVVETTKTYIAQFNKRMQKSGETTQTYASELKGLYDLAYPNRDRETRRVDL